MVYQITAKHHDMLADHVIEGVEKATAVAILVAACPPLAGTVALASLLDRIIGIAGVLANISKPQAKGKLAELYADVGVEIIMG